MPAWLADLTARSVPPLTRSGTEPEVPGSEPCARNALGTPLGDDLDLGAEGLRREAAVPPDAERALRTVEGHDPPQDPDAVLAGPHDPGSQELGRVLRLGG